MKSTMLSILLMATVMAVAGKSAGASANDQPTSGAATAKTAPAQDIVTTAVAAGQFTTLAAALKAAGLVETLQGKGPFTVFAPTDEAFAKLPTGTVEELLKPENKAQLTSILTYHVVPGNIMAKGVAGMKDAGTVNGQSLTITVKEGVVSVDAARVVKTDIECSNGVIHVIDTVLIPRKAE